MATVLITVHLIIVLFLIVVVLLQRSEGGGLGIGGGMMTQRQSGDALTKTTTLLAVAFFATSLGLGILARYDDSTGGVLDRAEQIEGDVIPGEGGLLDQLGGDIETVPVAPVEDGGVPITE